MNEPEPTHVQMMDTAPRDGTEIVLHVDRNTRARGRWDAPHWRLNELLRLSAGFGRERLTWALEEGEVRCWNWPHDTVASPPQPVA